MNTDWQYGLGVIRDRGAYLLKNHNFADIRFITGQRPDQRIFLGHKLIFAMASPVFERMFYGPLATNAKYISIPDVSPDTFYSLMEYIYFDQINITSIDLAFELYYAAKKYMLPHFFDQCTQYMIANLNPVDACRIYETGKLFDEPLLMQKSMKTIVLHTQDVINDPSFMNIEIDTLIDIFDQEELSIESELDLFNALVNFASKRGDKNVKATIEERSKRKEKSEDSSEEEPQEKICKHDNTEDNYEDSMRTEIKVEPDLQVINMFNDPLRTGSPEVVDVESDESIDLTVPFENSKKKFMTVEQLNSVLRKIRFLSMTPKQFASGPALSNCLKPDEALAILILISCPSITDCEMPAGFCTSISKRNSCTTANLPNSNFNTTQTIYKAPASRKPILYCNRAQFQQFEFHNANVSDSILTFQVDRNIWIKGIKIPTQSQDNLRSSYTEILYVHIQHLRGSRIRYAHLTMPAKFGKIEEITFDHPVYIHPNQIYKIFVTFNVVGRYPMFSCLTEVDCNEVHFQFKVGGLNESVRDSLIHGIIFQTAEHVD